VHTGGVDLIFPHHTNEIAQSCCANPGSKYAKFWVHNGFLTVNGEKMSKSLGNFVTIDELLKKGIDGEAIRYVLLASHYRKPLDWNEKALSDATKALNSFYRIIQEADGVNPRPTEEFMNSLLDDLNTPQSFAILHDYAHQYNKTKDPEFAKKLKTCANLIGFLNKSSKEWFINEQMDIELIDSKIKQRIKAKQEKDWALADKIRDELRAQAILLEDKPDGTSSWRINKL
ncbi:MAG: DALR domain-containing protein, partial [Pseudomonadota bacterium]